MFLISKFKIFGHSMEPTLKAGDIILISNLFYLFNRPKINDIVVFEYDNKFILKRIIDIQKNKYVMAGDNINDSKNFKYIQRENIKGKFFYKI